MTYDIAIIGAGPGGYVAALRAASLGAKVALIEKDQLGGVCLNRGCIPTKSFIASAHALKGVLHAAELGVRLPEGEPSIDMRAVQARKTTIVENLRGGIEKLLKGRGVELLHGQAAFQEGGALAIDGNAIEAKHVLIATGSKWIELPGIPIDHERIVTSDAALDWTFIPEHLVIVGGGVIGCEFACMMQTFGAKVTIIEAMDSILPPVEGAISRLLARAMKGRGIDIRTKTTVDAAVASEGGVSVTLSGDETITASHVLVAVGRRPDVSALNVSAAGVEVTERGAIAVNERFQTSNEQILAIGDVIGGWMLAHAASHQGIAAMQTLFGHEEACTTNVVPSPIFTDPEIAGVGKTAEQLKSDGVDFRTGRFPYAASGKALCDGDPDGQAIVHIAADGKLLGVHLIGREATTMIAEAALAVSKGMRVRDIEETIHSHPTLPEVLAEAAADAEGRAVHKLGRPR